MLIETDIGDVQIMTTHLKNNQGPAERAKAVDELFQTRIDDHPCVFGGDFNTSTLNPTQHTDPLRERSQLSAITPDRFRNPVPFEPLFEVAHATGFQWGTYNPSDVAQRPRKRGYPRASLGQIDWLLIKQLIAQHAQTIPAIGAEGRTLSDHDLITYELTLT